jgi:hypothetical protein
MPGPHGTSESITNGSDASGWLGRVVEPVKQAIAPDHLLLFSKGEVSRQQAMRRLGVGYGELLDLLADRRLPLPRVSAEEATSMAALIVSLTDKSAR